MYSSCEDILYRVIGNVDILPFDLTEWYCQYQQPDSDTEIYRSLWLQIHYDVTDENNNASSEDLDIHYH
jgi:hypothetical protein